MKVSVIGAGKVGSMIALRTVAKNLADVSLIDVLEGLPQGLALDLLQSSPIEGIRRKIIGTNDYRELEGSKVVVVTAGFPRKPGMTRLDLLKENARVVSSVVEEVKKWAPQAIVLMVTNPLDEMTYLAAKVSGFPTKKIMGMAGTLDSARFRYFIAEELNIVPQHVSAIVLGSHGDAMVPLSRFATANGKNLSDVLSPEVIDQIVERTKDAGTEIVSYLKSGSAFFAPSAAAVEMLEAILTNESKIVPVSVYVQGQYGLRDLFIGVPAKLGKNGVEEIIELDLDSEEKNALNHAAILIKNKILELQSLGY